MSPSCAPFVVAAAGEEAQCFELGGAVADHVPGERQAMGGKGGLAFPEPGLAVEAAGGRLHPLPAAEGEIVAVDLGAEDAGEKAELAPGNRLGHVLLVLPGLASRGEHGIPKPLLFDSEKHLANPVMFQPGFHVTKPVAA